MNGNGAGTVPACPWFASGREGIHHRDTENTEEGKGTVDQVVLRSPGSNSPLSQSTKFLA